MLFVCAFLFAPPAPPQLPVLQEESFLGSSQSDCFVFGSPLHLDGDRLVLSAFGVGTQELHVFRKCGGAWVSELATLGGGGLTFSAITAFDQDRFVVSSSDEHWSDVYRLVEGSWVREQFLTPRAGAGWAGLHGDRLVTTSQYEYPRSPFGVTIFGNEGGKWIPKGRIVPDAPQSRYTCCFPLDVFGDTVVFTARSAAGNQSIQVYVLDSGRWRKEAELWPASGGEQVYCLDLLGDKLAVGVQTKRTDTGMTAFVFEREQGTWRETAELFPGQVSSLALVEDTLVLGGVSVGASPGCAWVVERDRGIWTPTYELRASDGWSLGRSVAIEGRTVAVSSHWDRPRPGRAYLFELPPLARVNAYGSGINPPGSLVVLAGRPALGEEVTFGLANPIHAPVAGSAWYLGIAAQPSPMYPCGSRMGGFGMEGGAGEWLLARGPNRLFVTAVGIQTDPTRPFQTSLVIPTDPALIGSQFYLQGALRDPRRNPPTRWGLTNALELTIGL